MAALTVERDGDGRRDRRITLRLDGAVWLRVEPEHLPELGVRDGDELDDARVAAIEETLARTRARLFVVRSLAARAQSVAEIEHKLRARGIPGPVLSEAVEAAIALGYLDDAELAGQLARGMRSRGYGPRRAEQALRARAISGEQSALALRRAFGLEDEARLAREALRRRPLAPGESGMRKAVAFLVRRGFAPGAAWQAVRDELADREPG